MKKYIYSDLKDEQVNDLFTRKNVDLEAARNAVKPVQKAIREGGNTALVRYTEQFDGVVIKNFRVKKDTIDVSEDMVSDTFKKALRVAIKNIRTFHQQQAQNNAKTETMPGVTCWRAFRPIERVGVYVPGGSARLFSSMLMGVIPAQIAGCTTIAVCTPPQPNGSIAPEMLYAAKVLGNIELYTAGGSQAIFALAYGTETIPKVDKIIGPGNQYVTAAKVMVSEFCAIDMVAGPSEVLVYADATATPAWVAADLLSQAEHGPDSQVVLVTDTPDIVPRIEQEIETQLTTLPRADIARACLEKSFSVICENREDIITTINSYAPEHLILSTDDWEAMTDAIINAGSVFCGNTTPESLGDYASGTNHTLPTSGFARSCGGVSVETFGKYVTFQHATREGLLALGPVVETLAKAEELEAHARAVTTRLS